MRFSKLIATLKVFDKAETKRLEAFLHSPYFEIPGTAVALYRYLKKLHYKLPPKQLEPAALAKKEPLLKGKARQDKAGTLLLKAMQQFIALEQGQKNEAEQMFASLKGYKEKHLFDLFHSAYQKAEQELAENSLQDIDVFYQRHLLTEITWNGFDAKLKPSAENNLLPVFTTLDEFYALKKLRYLCEAVNRKEAYGSYHPEENVGQLLHILKPYSIAKYPYVFLFVNAWQMLTSASYEKSASYYHLTKQYIGRQKSTSPSAEIKEVSDYCIAWTIQWNNRGYMVATREYLWWIEWKIKHRLFLANGKLQPVAFRNTLNNAVLCAYPLTWIKNFIDQYLPHLPPDKQNNNMTFAMGYYYYAGKKYSEAAYQFGLTEDEGEPIINCQLKRWSYMCAFESRTSAKGLPAQLNTFRRYVARHTTELHRFKPLFSLFISYSEKLLNAVDKEEKEKIARLLEKEEFFPGKDWLKEHLVKGRKTKSE